MIELHQFPQLSSIPYLTPFRMAAVEDGPDGGGVVDETQDQSPPMLS